MSALFIDFEASSLRPEGYPIEVAWISVTGVTECHFVIPEPTWTDWSDISESIHGIPRATLISYGMPAACIARKLAEAAEGCTLYSDAPVTDSRWLAKLMGTARLPALAVTNVSDASVNVCRPLLDRMPESVSVSLATSLVRQADTEADEAIKVRHRAKSDAWRLWYAWVRLQELVANALDGWPK